MRVSCLAHFDFFILTVRFAAFDEIYPQYLEIPEAASVNTKYSHRSKKQ